MTQDKSEEYILIGIQTFTFAIILALLLGFIAYAYSPQLGARILLSIPFILVGYGIIVFPILDLAGMRKLNTISTIIYTLLTVLYITLVAVLLEYYNVQWIVLYTALGMVSVIVASGYAYIRLTRDTPPICQGVDQAN
jgi:hypothetical protein